MDTVPVARHSATGKSLAGLPFTVRLANDHIWLTANSGLGSTEIQLFRSLA